jgi:molecular chaperone IbpA
MTHPLFILKQIEEQLANQAKTTYPPYNIKEVDEETFLIEIALAGLKEDDISIVLEKQILTVNYTKPADDTTSYIYKGISNKSFSKEFKLNEFVEVQGAELIDGLLLITLKKVIPEELKPKTIPIKKVEKLLTSEPKLLTE